MHIITARVPSNGYITVLLCSVVYWMRYSAGAKTNVLPSSVQPELVRCIPEGLEFCKQYRIPTRAYTQYVRGLVAGTKPSEAMDTALDTHLADLRAALPTIRRDHSISDESIQTINRVRLWHRNESPSTLEAIRASLTSLQVPDVLVKQFRTESKEIAPLVTTLQTVVKKMTGAVGLNVPLAHIEECRDRYPGLWSEYLAVKREINGVYKTTLRDYVRDAGGRVGVDAARKHFDSIGMPHRLPRGFKGLIGENGNLFTTKGDELKTYSGGPVTAVDPQAVIEMNPSYNPKLDAAGVKGNWVFKATLTTTKAKTGEPNVQYYYTGNKIINNRQKKFGLVDRLIAREKPMMARWRRDLKQRTPEDQFLAAQCEIIYETCARVGGKDAQNKSGSTFGLTTLCVGHVRKMGPNIVLDYVGKDSAQQKHTLKPETVEMREVIRLINRLRENKTRKDLLWTWDGIEFNATRLRAYFRRVSGVPDASPHKLRHLRGTRLARTELELATSALLSKRKLDQRAVDLAFKDAITTVGKLLGHVKGIGGMQTTVWTTSAKNYVDVSVMVDFYEQFKPQGVRAPAWLGKLKG